jgi:hypothetical protein
MPDFRNMIRLEVMLRETTAWGVLETAIALSLFYPVKKREDGTEYIHHPSDMREVIEQISWFYSCGKTGGEGGKTSRMQDAYDFDIDSDDIFSAFLEVYGINLARVPLNGLHWWEFISLLWGLPSDTTIKQKMFARTVDLNDIKDKYERQKWQRLRKLYAINRHKEVLTKEQIEQNTLNWADSILPRKEGKDEN